MNFYLGCAVWAYRDWVGEFYPPGSRSQDFLQLYSQRFTTVEGNTAFYSIPDRKTVHRWAEEVPAHFRFCLKLHKSITHQGLLQPRLPVARAFLERMRGLGDRLGPLFAQLPPGYSPENLGDLIGFLEAWGETGIPLAVEVRHPDWFTQPHAGELNRQLERLGIGRVLMDTRPIYDAPDDPQLESERRKPNVPLQPEVTAPFSLVRFISHPDRAFNAPYLTEWVERVNPWLRQGIQVYFFVHCPIEARSPHHARDFQQLLEEAVVPVPPLPWNELTQPPTQLSLL